MNGRFTSARSTSSISSNPPCATTSDSIHCPIFSPTRFGRVLATIISSLATTVPLVCHPTAHGRQARRYDSRPTYATILSHYGSLRELRSLSIHIRNKSLRMICPLRSERVPHLRRERDGVV